MRTSDFDFHLPEHLIARHPPQKRDGGRLLVLDREKRTLAHRLITDLPEYFGSGDVLVTNDSRVMKARLAATRPTGGKTEVLLVEALSGPRHYKAMVTGARRMRPGLPLTLGDGSIIEVIKSLGDGFVAVALPEDAGPLCEALGSMPLPPYLGRAPEAADLDRYQTVFSRDEATRSVAAPTAGLHFTAPLLEAIEASGAIRASITLDVGPGTFLPVRAETVEDHHMHEERFEVSEAAAASINAAQRVVAVGTTSVRTLEALGATTTAGAGRTDIFIRPGYTFEKVDALLTNFHLPKSTLLMLVSALAGQEAILDAYREAVVAEYRFFSYGDAMLIL